MTLPTTWIADAERIYDNQLRSLAHAWGLHEDDDNRQTVFERLLTHAARPGSAWDPNRGSFESYCYTVARQGLVRMKRQRKHLPAHEAVRAESRRAVEARTTRTIEDEQESRYRRGRPFRSPAHAAA